MAQVALSIALLIVAGLSIKSVRNLEDVNLGFNVNNVAVFTIAPAANGYEPVRAQGVYQQILLRLSGVPGVKSASFSNGLPLGPESGVPVSIPKPHDGSLGTFVRTFFSNTNPIGAYVRFGTGGQQGQEVEIVGVAGDTKSGRDIEKPVTPMLYTPSLQEEIGRATFEVRSHSSPSRNHRSRYRTDFRCGRCCRFTFPRGARLAWIR